MKYKNNTIYYYIFFFSAWLCIEFLILGKHSMIRMFDMGDHHIPYAISVYQNINEFGFFLWNKNIKSGVDLISQSYVWSNLVAFSLPYLFFSEWFSYSLTKLIITFLSIFFSYKIFREFINVSVSSSFLACLLLGIFFMNESSEGLLSKPFFPMVSYLIIKLSNSNKNNFFIFIFSLLLGVIYASSGFFIWDYFAHLGFLILGIIWTSNKKKLFIVLSIFYITVIVYQTQQFFPSFLNSNDSHRIILENVLSINNQYLANLREILFLHHQEIKIHLFLFIIFIFFINRFLKNTIDKKEKKLLIFLIFILIVGFVIPIIQIMFKNILPQITIIEASRNYKIVYPFILCCVFACNIEKLNIKNINLIIFFMIITFSLMPKINNIIIFLKSGNSYSNLYENELIKNIRNKDKSIYRVANITKDHVNSLLAGNVLSSYGLEMATGYGNLHYSGYDNFWKKVTKNKSFGNRLYLNINKINFNDNSINLEDNYNLKYFKLTNVKYIFSDYELISENLTLIHEPKNISKLKIKRIRNYSLKDLKNRIFEITKRGDDKKNSFFIYKLKNFIPRVFMMKKCDNIDIDKLNYSEFKTDNIEILKYSPDHLKIAVNNVNNNECLIILNNYSKFWEAKINSKFSNIDIIFETFWKVDLDNSYQNIEFFYNPPYRKYFEKIYNFN